MYDYKLVKIKLSKWNNLPKDDYHEIIAKHANEGWRFIQLFAPVTTGYGAASFFEIIFERPKP